MLTIRPATIRDDLDGIMGLEEECFHQDGLHAMASTEMMARRIEWCNGADPPWFYVATCKGYHVGYVIMQPTNLEPDDCTSWAAATDDGTMERTFDREGKHVYAVSFGVISSAPSHTSDMLVQTSLQYRLYAGKQYYMFCSRMPKFRDAHEKTGITAADYWQQRRADDGLPRDSLLNMYTKMFGELPTRLLPNGFPPDEASGGHGVLFVAKDPLLNLRSIAARIEGAAMRNARRVL